MSKKSSATKRLLWILGGLLILLVAFAVVGRITGMFGSGNSGTFVETGEAETRNITQIVTASGRVQPEVEVIISPDVSGEIIELPIKEGDTVQRGMLLARIKPDFYATQVEQYRAGVLQAKASMAQRQADLLEAESERQRQRDLFERAAIAKSVLEQAGNTVRRGRSRTRGSQICGRKRGCAPAPKPKSRFAKRPSTVPCRARSAHSWWNLANASSEPARWPVP